MPDTRVVAPLLPACRLMDAMILAAGLGTRLRPLTDSIPKPLLPVGGVPLLERIARRLVAAGADRLIINMHSHPDQIERFVAERDGFGAEVRLSLEPDAPFDTGGGLWHAREHFRRDAPFFLHNGDILTDAALGGLYEAHARADALATLAVRPPRASRYLLFDDDGLLGFSPRGGGTDRTVRAMAGAVQRHDFAGIHVIEPRIFDLISERGTFSIIDAYLRLAQAGEHIRAHAVDGVWLDIGTPAGLSAADHAARLMPV